MGDLHICRDHYWREATFSFSFSKLAPLKEVFWRDKKPKKQNIIAQPVTTRSNYSYTIAVQSPPHTYIDTHTVVLLHTVHDRTKEGQVGKVWTSLLRNWIQTNTIICKQLNVGKKFSLKRIRLAPKIRFCKCICFSQGVVRYQTSIAYVHYIRQTLRSELLT